MSSFQKFTKSVNIKGTKLKNNLPFISSGIPSLDHILGGGLPTGAIFLIEEDVLRTYSRVLCKYFLSEGVSCKHALFIATIDEDPYEIVKELPTPIDAPPADDITQANDELDKMKIAWRYEGLNQVESSFGINAAFGHHFDLSKHVDLDVIKQSNITYWTKCNQDTISGFQNKQYLDLLQKIKEITKADEFQTNFKGKQNILRICIPSLGSPFWTAKELDQDNCEIFGHDLLKFMYCLRVTLKDTNAAAFITVPAHLFEDDHLINRIIYSVDNSIKLESFAGSSRETNPVFKDYNGLFHITKLSALNTMMPFVPPSIDLAFKLRRKKFVIEKLHLPPELQESSEREQDDITATPSCGGFKKKDIDF